MSNTDVLSSYYNRMASAQETSAYAQKLQARIRMLMALFQSPQTLLGAVIAIIIMCAVLYVLVEFFSKNRFRGISLNIFSKLITVTDYINKFNIQLYRDFDNIKKYYDSHDASLYADYIDKVYFIDDNDENKKVLKEIHDFMQNIDSQRTFNKKVGAFFHPNPTFRKDITDAESAKLKAIFEALYAEDFHKKFSDWFNYMSIWNFAYKDSSDSLDTNLLKLKLHGTSTEEPTKGLADTINGLNTDISNNDFPSAMKKMEDYMNKIKSLVAQKATNKILDNMIREWEDKISELTLKLNGLDDGEKKDKIREAINDYQQNITDLKKVKSSLVNDVNSLFFSDTSINYESISQQLNDSCSLLDDDAKSKFLNEFNEMSIGQGKLKSIVESTSFINVLNALNKSNYNVSQNTLRGINNIHPHILEVFKTINGNITKKEEKASILYNACFEVFNEFIYTKYTYNGVGEFMFLEDKDINDLSQNELYNHILQYFNVHMILLYRENIKYAKKFNNLFNTTDNENKNKPQFDLITEAHVSIARLKYLIQDYFVIIMEYNDKSFPDKSDIRDFWQKRVNSFGISMPGTKKFNRPRDAPDVDYVATRTNRSRKNKLGERNKLFNADGNVVDDLDQVLKKNTPWELYLEYLRAIRSQRHPKIPFFQSIMAGIRFMFPDPNTVLDNFLAQLKGRAPPPSNKQINWDFSFKYDPYTRVIDGMIDRFSDPEVGADKMEDVVTLTKQDPGNMQAAATSTNTKAQAEGAAGAASAKVGTKAEINHGDDPNAPKPEPKPEPKNPVCGPNEKKRPKNRMRPSAGYRCVPKTQADINRENDYKIKEQKRKEFEKNRCRSDQIGFYRNNRGGGQTLICRPKPQPKCPPGQKEKIVRMGRGRTKPTCVPA